MRRSSRNPVSIDRYMDGLLSTLRRKIPRAIGGWDADAIHDARVATRRLAAALDLLDPVIPGKNRKRFADALREIRRRLGSLRDLDVMLDHLKEFVGAGATDPAAEWISERLRETRRCERKRAAQKLPADEAIASLRGWAVLRDRVRDAEKELDALLAQSLHDRFALFADHAAGLTAAAGPDGSVSAGGKDDPHALRIAGKKLRYRLELADALGRDVPPGVKESLKRMQDALGRWHDDLVLSQEIMRRAIDEKIGHHDRTLYRQLLNLSRGIGERGERGIEEFAGIWRESGPEIRGFIEQRFVNLDEAKEEKAEASVGDSRPAISDDGAPHVEPVEHVEQGIA